MIFNIPWLVYIIIGKVCILFLRTLYDQKLNKKLKERLFSVSYFNAEPV